jgi:integrase
MFPCIARQSHVAIAKTTGEQVSKRRAFGYIRKLPSGRWQASYIGPDNNRHNAPLTFSAKTDANHWLVREEAAIIEGRWAKTIAEQVASPTFIEYASRHIEIQTGSNGNLLRESTKELYRRLLALHLSTFHGLKLAEISSAKIANWWAKCNATGKVTTASKAYKLLSAVLSRAVREGHLPSNACNVRGAHYASTGLEIVVPTAEEIQQIAGKINPRYRELVLICAYAGLRFGEATELRFSDLERGDSQGSGYWINVRRAVVLVDKQHIVGPPKSVASIRKVPISAHATGIIENIINARGDSSEDALVFPSSTGSHLRHDVFTNEWKRALSRAGITSRITPHSLRHFAGSNLARLGGNLAELKAWLGDSSTSAVMRYIHETGRTETLVQKMKL